MAFEFQYVPEQSFILIRVNGDVSLQENRDIGLQIAQTLQTAETQIDILFDLRAMGRFPTSLSQLRQSSAIIRSPKVGWFVLLTGDRPLLKLVATSLIQLQTKSARMRVFDTLRETIGFLQGIQPGARYRADWFDDLHRSIM